MEDAHVRVSAVVCVFVNAKERFLLLRWANLAEEVLVFHLSCFRIQHFLELDGGQYDNHLSYVADVARLVPEGEAAMLSSEL